jgi:hypothetical protein
VRLRILGPLRVWRGEVELDPGPPQQAYLLALLLARPGRPISQDELIDLIWGKDVPASAVNAIHKGVGALRRLLEPTLPARGTGSYLRRRAGGYEFLADAGVLDLLAFRSLVEAAEGALARGNREVSLDRYGAVTDAAAARAEVPSTVRDIVRSRIADLDDATTGLLQIAALIGRDVDLSVLARAAGLDIQACLDRLEPLEALGLLGPVADDPFSFRFAHDLIRESIASVTPPQQATRLHFRVAEAIDLTGTADEPAAERLAYHLWASGPLADPARTAGALIRAGRRAATKSAFEAAERQLRSAIQVARAAGLAELELSAVSLLTTVFTRQFDRAFPYEMLERAEDLARELGREREAADFHFSRFVWAISSVTTERGPLARRLLDQGETSPDPVVLAYGRQAWGMYQWDIGNIGEALRYMGDNWTVLDELSQREENPLLKDMQELWGVVQALVTTMHGDASAAHRLFDLMEAEAGESTPCGATPPFSTDW